MIVLYYTAKFDHFHLLSPPSIHSSLISGTKHGKHPENGIDALMHFN